MTGVNSRVEMALTPDRAADPLSWDWTNITDSSRAQGAELSITRGKASGGANETPPGSMSLAFGNPRGIYTPGRADSIYYPNLKRGTQVRAVVTGQRDPYLALTGEAGSRCSTPDNAALDIVGDLSVAVEFECPLRVPPDDLTYWELASKWTEAANLSWRLLIAPVRGALTLEWTTGGTTATQQTWHGRMGIPRPDAGILTVGVWLDVDNLVGGKTITWYVARGKTITDLIASPATYVHDAETTAGTTSIFSGTAPVDIGDNTGSASSGSAPGKIRRAIIRAGSMSGGTIAANPTFTDLTPGALSFTDSAGRVWTVNSPASISDDQVRMLGDLASATPVWPGGGPNVEAAQIQWDVQGMLSRMRQGNKPVQSTMFRRVLTSWLVDNVVAYWPLEDGPVAGAGSTPLRDIPPMTVAGDWEWGADSTNPAAQPLPHVDGTIAFSGQVSNGLRTIGKTQFRTDFLVKITTPNVSPALTWVMGINTSGTVKDWAFTINDTSLVVNGYDTAGASLVTSTAGVSTTFFGVWCLWSFNIEQNGGNVDWSLRVAPNDTGVTTVYSGSVAGSVGVPTTLHNWGNAAPSSGGISYGHMVVTQGLSHGWLAPADTAYRGEPAGRRFYRLCQENGIQGLVDGVYSYHWEDALPAGAKPMGPQRPGTLLSLLEECALVENARIGESRELRALTYRSAHVNQAPALTVNAELGNPFEPTDDTQQLVNDVTVSLPQGTSYHLDDQTSIDADDKFDDTRTINAQTGLQLPDLASWWLHEGTWPGMRVPVLRVHLGNNPGLFDYWLAAEPGDLVRFMLLPTGFGEVPFDVLVDGWTEELSKFHWAMSLNVSPAGPWEVGIRDNATLGIRDTGGSVLNSSFAAGTATSMSVLTTLGPEWAQTAATNTALPFDVNVGGARITVTAIGAPAASVQTFTVVQTPVNGIVKTVGAGTAVNVWRPARRALLRRVDA